MGKQPSDKEVVAYWLTEIDQAKKREAAYRKDGQEVLKIYEADEEKEVPFNILFSNTETLMPALYSQAPRPIVNRRFRDEDPMGKAVSDAGRRMLEYLTDTNMEGYETFHEVMHAVNQDALLPGRGWSVVKYDAEFKTLEEPRPPQQHDDDPPGPPSQEPAEYADHETVCVESIVWDRVYMGYAKKWHKVPWVAYEYHLTKEEVASLVGPDMAVKLKYSADHREDASEEGTDEDQTTGKRKTACVYQIWDKAGGKKIKYVSPNHKEDVLKTEDDPLQLTGFFNCPRPLRFIEKSWSLVPTSPYRPYKNQAKELNRLTQRINHVAEAIKARGVYDGALGTTLQQLLNLDDAGLVPADSAASLATEKGFQNAIWFMPLEQLIQTLVQLYTAREACKQVIYEITGISDILRGATKASETLGAQEMKAKFGGLRIKHMQAEVQRYARDLLRMMLELAGTKFSEETWAAVTGLPFLLEKKYLELTALAQTIQQQLAMAPPPMPGQPPDPRLMQLQQIQAELQKPKWSDVLGLLRNDLMRSYRIDIETNSTIEADATEDKKDMTELFTALSQIMAQLAPLVIEGVLPFEAAQAILLAVSRRMKWGTEIEDYIKQMKPPQPKGDDGEAQKKQIEQEKQMAVKEVQHKQKQAEMSIQEKSAKSEFDQFKREMELKMREMELQIQEQQMAMQKQAAVQEVGMKQKQASMQIQSVSQQAQFKNQQQRLQNDQRSQQQQAQFQQKQQQAKLKEKVPA